MIQEFKISVYKIRMLIRKYSYLIANSRTVITLHIVLSRFCGSSRNCNNCRCFICKRMGSCNRFTNNLLAAADTGLRAVTGSMLVNCLVANDCVVSGQHGAFSDIELGEILVGRIPASVLLQLYSSAGCIGHGGSNGVLVAHALEELNVGVLNLGGAIGVDSSAGRAYQADVGAILDGNTLGGVFQLGDVLGTDGDAVVLGTGYIHGRVVNNHIAGNAEGCGSSGGGATAVHNNGGVLDDQVAVALLLEQNVGGVVNIEGQGARAGNGHIAGVGEGHLGVGAFNDILAFQGQNDIKFVGVVAVVVNLQEVRAAAGSVSLVGNVLKGDVANTLNKLHLDVVVSGDFFCCLNGLVAAFDIFEYNVGNFAGNNAALQTGGQVAIVNDVLGHGVFSSHCGQGQQADQHNQSQCQT